MKIEKDMVAASAKPLVLGILGDGEATYGYAILKRIRELSDGQLEWTDGMLYPLLHRLERLGQIESSWQTSEEGRRRKHYKLTDPGRRELAERRTQWQVISRTLNQIWADRFPITQLNPEVAR